MVIFADHVRRWNKAKCLIGYLALLHGVGLINDFGCPMLRFGGGKVVIEFIRRVLQCEAAIWLHFIVWGFTKYPQYRLAFGKNECREVEEVHWKTQSQQVALLLARTSCVSP